MNLLESVRTVNCYKQGCLFIGLILIARRLRICESSWEEIGELWACFAVFICLTPFLFSYAYCKELRFLFLTDT